MALKHHAAPQFFRVALDGPRRPAALPPDHASARLAFRSAPGLGLEHDFEPDRGVSVESLPASLGTWSGRVEDGSNPATRNRRASRNHSAPIFNITPDYVERMFRAHRPKAAQPAPKKVRCLELARGLVVCRRAMTKIEVLSVHVCTSCGP